MIFFWFLQN